MEEQIIVWSAAQALQEEGVWKKLIRAFLPHPLVFDYCSGSSS